eukprot:scaffold1184_cov132-Cylindrotheca_fusiformis.AAC.56
METVWTIFFWLIPIWTFVLIPFSTFYYESDDGLLLNPGGAKQSRIRPAITYTLACIIVVGIIFAIAYFTASDAEIPVHAYAGKTISEGINQETANERIIFVSDAGSRGVNFTTALLSDMVDGDAQYVAGQTDLGDKSITLTVSISSFFAGLMAWLGWFLFAIFGGIGMSALPLDLILAYKNRPRRMDAAEYAEAQTSLRERVNELVSIGEMIKLEQDGKSPGAESKNPFNKAKRKERQAMTEFKQAVFLLQQDVEDFQACTSEYEKTNPLLPYIYLVIGFFCLIISILWIIHIVVYVLPSPPWMLFLNTYFTWFDSWFPLFGVLSVALFTLYMLFAAIKGCFKFGMRCGFYSARYTYGANPKTDHLHPMILGTDFDQEVLK